MSVGPGTAVRERPVHQATPVQISDDLAARLVAHLSRVPEAKRDIEELVEEIGAAQLGWKELR